MVHAPGPGPLPKPHPTYGGCGHRLSEVHPAPGQSPQAVVDPALKENPPLLVCDDGGDTNDEGVGCGRFRIVVVLRACHACHSIFAGWDLLPYGLEALSVGIEETAFSGPAEVVDGGAISVHPEHVGVHDHLLVAD
ncbi:hypothetical protein GCM10009555_028110 [Acrocarpospora macrocephala]